MSRYARIASLSLLLLAVALRADPSFRYPDGKHAHGEMKYRNGLPVLVVSGAPEEMGAAVGKLALAPARRLVLYPQEMLQQIHLELLYPTIVKAGQKIVDRLPVDFRAEMKAMSESANIELERLVVANTIFDIKKMVACSALSVEPARSATGGSLLARNLDFPTLGYAHEYSLVTVYKPKNAKHTFATIGFPGLLGCLSGMNDAGLAVAVLEVMQVKTEEKSYDSQGTPYALCYRRLLEECATIEEAHRKLSAMKRIAIGNLAVADRNGVAVFEISPERVVVRRGDNGATVCTNHFCTEELKPRLPIGTHRTYTRFEALDKVAALRKKLGLAELHVALHAVHAKNTMQTMIFEPATLRLHLGIGEVPASAKELQVLDLAELLKR